MELVFVRHGSTAWNAEGRFQGQSDIGLDDDGRAQAAELARTFSGERFDAIVSSDLRRAFETAEEIAAGRPVVTDGRWREFAFGEWEGRSVSEVDPGTNARAYAPPGGETFDAVCSRVRPALEELRASGMQRVLIVTHAGTLHAVLGVLFEEPVVVRFLPASITCVRLDADAELLCVGITGRQYAEWKGARGVGQE